MKVKALPHLVYRYQWDQRRWEIVTNITKTRDVAIWTMDQACTPKPLLDFVRGRRDLLDHPLMWTLRHLESLGCHFDDVATSTSSESPPQDSKHTDDAEGLARNLSPEWKLRCICRILLGEGQRFARVRQGSHFYFQGRPAMKVLPHPIQ
ncbi:hypothetical protein N8T08_004695 [Aspergillus melleus]|uniref:Uncharacterized protein n=1 Tax=Aspergillus melleus TaxID=138277 RepID=A0ACC3B462_9EURO|nr:hypothetical protein N8T08_004695 [Aspergillus melleus]